MLQKGSGFGELSELCSSEITFSGNARNVSGDSSELETIIISEEGINMGTLEQTAKISGEAKAHKEIE